MFQLARFEAGESGLPGRRLLTALPGPVVVSQDQVAVDLPSVGGYYYLTGGQAPLVNASSGVPAGLQQRTYEPVVQMYLSTVAIVHETPPESVLVIWHETDCTSHA